MLLKIAEAAGQLGIAKKTLRKWIREGKISGVYLGRQWRIDSRDLEQFIALRKT